MPLASALFSGDPKLEACLVNDAAHVTTGAVGPHVGKIQTALADIDGLEIDSGETSASRYGPATAAAVLWFKRKRNIINYSYQTQADDIVGKMTIAALDREMRDLETKPVTTQVLSKAADRSCRVHKVGGGGPPPLPPNPYRVDYIKALLADAQRCIMAAHTKLLMAMPVANQKPAAGGGGALGRAALMALINKHFDVDHHADPGHSISGLAGIFLQMHFAFVRPGGLWGAEIFEMDPVPKGNENLYAYTWWGGFHLPGVKHGKIRRDTIYLCPVLDGCTRDDAVQTIIHELAHFVGPGVNRSDRIDDYAYGQFDDPKMKALNPYRRMHNAESFGNFAFEAQFGRVPARI